MEELSSFHSDMNMKISVEMCHLISNVNMIECLIVLFTNIHYS
jgi:hypothetical protein